MPDESSKTPTPPVVPQVEERKIVEPLPFQYELLAQIKADEKAGIIKPTAFEGLTEERTLGFTERDRMIYDKIRDESLTKSEWDNYRDEFDELVRMVGRGDGVPWARNSMRAFAGGRVMFLFPEDLDEEVSKEPLQVALEAMRRDVATWPELSAMSGESEAGFDPDVLGEDELYLYRRLLEKTITLEDVGHYAERYYEYDEETGKERLKSTTPRTIAGFTDHIRQKSFHLFGVTGKDVWGDDETPTAEEMEAMKRTFKR